MLVLCECVAILNQMASKYDNTYMDWCSKWKPKNTHRHTTVCLTLWPHISYYVLIIQCSKMTTSKLEFYIEQLLPTFKQMSQWIKEQRYTQRERERGREQEKCSADEMK